VATLVCGTLKAMLAAAAARAGPAALAELALGVRWSDARDDENDDDGGGDDDARDDDDGQEGDAESEEGDVAALRDELEHVSDELERQREKAVQREKVRTRSQGFHLSKTFNKKRKNYGAWGGEWTQRSKRVGLRSPFKSVISTLAARHRSGATRRSVPPWTERPSGARRSPTSAASPPPTPTKWRSSARGPSASGPWRPPL
jgi:hypothetical protein